MKPYYPVVRVFGILLACFSLTMLAPLLFSHYAGDGAETAYDEAMLISLTVGLGLWWAARRHREDLKVRDGFLLVVMVWALLPVFACLPFILPPRSMIAAVSASAGVQVGAVQFPHLGHHLEFG